MKDKRFVPFELANLAFTHDFYEDCFGYFTLSNKEFHYNPLTEYAQQVGWIYAPTYQELVDWFEIKHKILIEPLRDATGYWNAWITNNYTKTHRGYGNFICYSDRRLVSITDKLKSRYTCLDQALEEAFKLI